MFHLIYQSFDEVRFSEKDLKRLLLRSRIRNAAEGLTGILLLHDGVFLQALEGDEVAVKATFARIAEDPRHRDICVIASGSMSDRRRIFGNWSMGFSRAGETTKLLAGYVETHDLPNFTELSAPMAINLLRWASERSSRAPAEALD